MHQFNFEFTSQLTQTRSISRSLVRPSFLGEARGRRLRGGGDWRKCTIVMSILKRSEEITEWKTRKWIFNSVCHLRLHWLAQQVACLVSLGYQGSTEEMGPRATMGHRELPVKLDLRALKGPKVLKENRMPMPKSLRELETMYVGERKWWEWLWANKGKKFIELIKRSSVAKIITGMISAGMYLKIQVFKGLKSCSFKKT